MMKITVEGATVQAVIEGMRSFLDGVATPIATASAEKKTAKVAKAETTAPAAPATTTPATTTPATIAPATTAPATTAPATADATPVATFVQVADILPKIVTKLGRPVTVALLAKFNAKRGGELKENQYGEFVAFAEGLLNGTQKIDLPA